jgi:hypothetical protein
VKEKPTVAFPFFGAIPSDRIPKATKDISVCFFIHSCTFGDELTVRNAVAAQNACKLHQRMPGTTCNEPLRRVRAIIVAVEEQ